MITANSIKAQASGKKRANPWVTFLKEYSKKHNIKYGEAIADKNAKAEYKKLKEGNVKKENNVKFDG